jgi:hypothetical protein
MTEARDPLPIGSDLSPDEIRARFEMTELRTGANPDFGVRFLVPRGWSRVTIDGMERAANADQLTPVAALQAPDGTGVAPIIFHVQVVTLPRELRASSFIASYGLQRKLELLVMREMSPVFADALLRQPIDGEPFLLRMAVRFDGDRAFVVSGVAHERDYDAQEVSFGVMVASLGLLTPSPRRTIEDRRRAVLLDRVAFDYPASWAKTLAPDGSDTHAAYDLLTADPAGAFTGWIRVELDMEPPAITLEGDFAIVRAHAELSNVTLEDEFTEVGITPGPGAIVPLGMRIYRGTLPDNDIPQEIWATILDVGGARLRVWMLTAARGGSFDHWAVNERGYRILLETLCVPS